MFRAFLPWFGKISNLIRYPVFSAKKSYQMEFLYHLTGQSSFLHLDKTNMWSYFNSYEMLLLLLVDVLTGRIFVSLSSSPLLIKASHWLSEEEKDSSPFSFSATYPIQLTPREPKSLLCHLRAFDKYFVDCVTVFCVEIWWRFVKIQNVSLFLFFCTFYLSCSPRISLSHSPIARFLGDSYTRENVPSPKTP